MARSDDPERWRPDEALVITVRTRVLPISELSGPDRAWLVAQLTAQGWTVAAIAERLACSLRLIQQIKAEPMTLVATYALGLERQLIEERGLRRLVDTAHRAEIATRDAAITRLTAQRDLLLDQIPRRQHNHGKAVQGM